MHQGSPCAECSLCLKEQWHQFVSRHAYAKCKRLPHRTHIGFPLEILLPLLVVF